MINSGNKRREDTQALMIPEFAKAGFKVVADNSDADTVFQKRLPSLDYDLAMYINTASPDPTVTGIMACDSVPSPENNNQGQNSTGWCNEDASKLMTASDQEVDETKRVDIIHQIGQALVDDHVLLPLFQFPNIAAWRTDKLGGPVDADAGNYRARSTTSTSGSQWAVPTSSSVPSSGRTASTRSRSAPTRRGSSGRPTCRCSPAFGTPRRTATPSPRW